MGAMTEAEIVKLVNALRILRLTTYEIHVQTGIDMDVIRAIPWPEERGDMVSMRTDYPATLHPGPDAGRDPSFVKAEALLDSPRTAKGCMGLCYGVMWAFLLFMFLVFCDVMGMGRFIYS